MEQGASLRVIAEYVEPGLSPQLQDLLREALNNLRSETLHGYSVAWVLLSTEAYVPGLSSLASRLLDLTETDALLLGNVYNFSENENNRNIEPESPVSNRLTIIGRSRIEGTNLSELFKPFGGGGHARAASLATRDVDPLLTLNQLADELKTQIPHPPTARELMSSPVRSIRPETSVGKLTVYSYVTDIRGFLWLMRAIDSPALSRAATLTLLCTTVSVTPRQGLHDSAAKNDRPRYLAAGN
jgi:tRNA nucleotidyltransferase (CCA-adding enzyme)